MGTSMIKDRGTMEEKAKITVKDPYLGEREVSSDLGIIVDQLKLLRYFRDDGRTPSEALLDDIATYEYILNSGRPEELARTYFENKWEDDIPLSPREVADKLDWRLERA